MRAKATTTSPLNASRMILSKSERVMVVGAPAMQAPYAARHHKKSPKETPCVFATG
jgi:hypothetical protein